MVNYFELDEQTYDQIYDLQGQTAGKVMDYIIDQYPQLKDTDIFDTIYDAISNNMCITAESGINGDSSSEEIQDGIERDYNIRIPDELAEEIAGIINEDNIEYEIMFEED